MTTAAAAEMSRLAADSAEILIGGFSRAELDAAFKLVCDPTDWKAPIDATVHKSLVPLVTVAIQWYTGEFSGAYPINAPGLAFGERFRVASRGYRANPARI